MSLDFNASLAYVDHSTGLNLDSQTWIVWGFPNSVTNTGRRLAHQSNTGFEITVGNVAAGNGKFRYFRDRATTDTSVRSAASTVTATTWQMFAVIDGDGVTPRIYRGTLTATIAEIVTYDVQTAGSGAAVDMSANSLSIGGLSGANTHTDWRIAYLWAYNRVLTLGEIKLHQFRPGTKLSGCVLYVSYGFNGTGTQVDWSGSVRNGTVSGSPAVAAHAPLGAPFLGDEWTPYVVSAHPRLMMMMGMG